ncbi:hypothetical protein C1H46_020379 [Malus baccata]|uniref:Uncharacterized protein n=1 Tax=Malus baccata TaxID=106549 RepID=A0A540M5R6_MALBA|nr:hypothetical protein C1H46_020379 [Malus baccata]
MPIQTYSVRQIIREESRELFVGAKVCASKKGSSLPTSLDDCRVFIVTHANSPDACPTSSLEDMGLVASLMGISTYYYPRVFSNWTCHLRTCVSLG